MREIKDVLLSLRTDSDCSQKDIAELLGVSQQYYSRYETGKYEIPVRHLKTLATYYHVSMDFITGDAPYKMITTDLDKHITKSMTVGQLMDAVLSLPAEGQRAVADYVELQLIKMNGQK